MRHYNSRVYKRFISVFVLMFVIYIISVVYTKITAFDYSSDLDKSVMTIDGYSVTLRELGYYIAEIESFTQQQAVLYDPEDPLVYWNLYFSARENSTFVSDYAREVAISNCLCDIIYEQAAIENGISLSEELSDLAVSNADLFYVCLSDEQREKLGMSEDIVIKIERRKLYASEYISYLLRTDPSLADQLDTIAAESDPPVTDPLSLLTGTGKYFKENILPLHRVTYNRKILRKLPLGRITVN